MYPEILLFGSIFSSLVLSAHAAIIPASSGGEILTPSTWGGNAITPAPGLDLNTWLSNGVVNLYYSNATFGGGIFVLNAGTKLQSGQQGVIDPGADPTFRHFTFDGGSIHYERDLNSTFSFGTNRVTVTPAGGNVTSTDGTNRDVWFDGGVWMGSGELKFSHPTASDSTSTVTDTLQTFRLTNADLSNFTGTFTAVDKAIFELTQSITTPTFSLKLLGNSRYDNVGDYDIAVRSLVIADVELPPGIYQKGNGSLTVQQEAYLLTPAQIRVGSLPTPHAFPDSNGNGFHDFVEISNRGVDFKKFHQNPTLDSDGDGQTDVNEFIARTNPVDRMSFIACELRQVTGTDVTLGFFGKSGVRYQLQWSPDMLGWATFQDSVTGNDSDMTLTRSFTNLGVTDPRKLFFRMRVLDSAISTFVDNGSDSDSDGLSNAAESFIAMFDASKPDSMRSASNGGDSKHLNELLRGVNLSESLTDKSYAESISPENAARFLFQAGFGPREADIIAVQNLGYEGWINAQLAKPPYSSYFAYLNGIEEEWKRAGRTPANATLYPYETRVTGPGMPQSNLSTAFMRGVVHGDDVLRQKSVWALLQIIVASGAGFIPSYGKPGAVYIDLFHDKCFGRYEDLLYAVSVNGHMGNWLTFINNKKANPAQNTLPDENYAREIMQLFTLGLYQMNQDGSYKTDTLGALIPTYGSNDVSELAKSFTGLKPTYGSGRIPGDPVNSLSTSYEMFAEESDHDITAKSLLNGYLQIPANTNVKDEIRLVCRQLVQHPNCAPYVSTRLIQNLVTSEPSPEYVARISKVFRDTDGDLGDVIKAILLDPEARGPRFLTEPRHGKLREPLIRFASLVRAFEVGTEVDPAPYTKDNLQFWKECSLGNQQFFAAPSVFNFFESTYTQPGELESAGIRSPEFQLLDATTNLSFLKQVRGKLLNYIHTPHFIYPNDSASEPAVQFRLLKEIAMLSDSIQRDDLVDRLSLLMTGGLADAAARADYREPIEATGSYATSWASETSANRLKYAILKLFADSACAIQK